MMSMSALARRARRRRRPLAVHADRVDLIDIGQGIAIWRGPPYPDVRNVAVHRI